MMFFTSLLNPILESTITNNHQISRAATYIYCQGLDKTCMLTLELQVKLYHYVTWWKTMVEYKVHCSALTLYVVVIH